MNITTFIIIAIIVYGIFARKDKPPQRRPGNRDLNYPEGWPAPKQTGGKRPFSKYDKGTGGAETAGAGGTSWAEGASGWGGTVSLEGTAGTEGSSGIEGTSGSEGTPGYEGTFGSEGTRKIRTKGPEGPKGPEQTSGFGGIAQQQATAGLIFSSSDIVQGVIWAEILRQPKGKTLFRAKR